VAFQCDAFQQSAFQNDCAAAAEALSGGWRPRLPSLRPGHWPRHESDEAREARIKDERVRMGILPTDPVPEPALDVRTAPVEARDDRRLPDPYRLAAHLLPEDLAGLEALAARAAELTIDAEIALWLRLEEQRRLHEAWLRDEDDAAVLMLAIATIH
jgi:hypothetical protein